jgi:seryl-tRNA synthetase
VRLAHPIPIDLADELSRRVYFVDDRITGFSPVLAGDLVMGLRVTTDRPVTAAELAAKVDLMVVSDLLGRLATPEVVRWRSVRSDPPARPVFDDMLHKGLAIVTGDGQVAVAKPVLDLMDRLDALLAGIARTELSATEYRYPTLISTQALRRSGYVTSFPQHLMYTTRLRADIHNYRDFLAEAGTTADFTRTVLAHSDTVDLCLPPTMCYHTFQQFADGRLPTAEMTVTARGKSFRFEGRYHAGLERLWDFTIREIVFLGSKDFAASSQDRMRRLAGDLMDALDLTGHCEVANDPFFGDAQTGTTISAQRLLERKHELRLAVAPDRTIAVGSFNIHDGLFSTSFAIEQPDGSPAYSACVGFGLERMAYAVLCQHGLDRAGWPEVLRRDHDDWEGRN